MKYKYKKSQIFGKRLDIPKVILKKVYNSTLDVKEYFKYELERAVEYHSKLKSGEIEQEHAYSMAYASKAVRELKKKVEIAQKLWGEGMEQEDEV